MNTQKQQDGAALAPVVGSGLRSRQLQEWCDPDQQDLVNALNSMARAAMEGDEKAYDAFYFRAMEMVDELHAELSKKAGWPE